MSLKSEAFQEKVLSSIQGVAVFSSDTVKGEVLFTSKKRGRATLVQAFFEKLPSGKHGFHIHRAGDLRGEGCMGACEHYHRGKPMTHGPEPGKNVERHTGDLGNIEEGKRYLYLVWAPLHDLFGRSAIVHADEDDLGKGEFEDSRTTGHSGARIGCALIGRAAMSHCQPKRTKRKTRKLSK
jgi:Cu-Zn family superoxide dismutase